MNICRNFARCLIVSGILAAVLSACGGGGGSSDAPPPTADTAAPLAKINFPPSQALTITDSITVTGTASDAAGNTISSVTVNNVAATSSDGFANWTATIALNSGDNTVTVATADDQGNSESQADSISIRNEVPLLNPSDIEIDTGGGRALLVDAALRALVAVDLNSGLRSIVSDDDTGTGNSFSAPNGVAYDAVNNRAFVADGSEIIAVDLANGNRSVFSSLAGEAVARDVALEESGSRRLLLISSGDNGNTVKLQTVPSTGGAAADFSPAVTFTADSSVAVDDARALVASIDGTVVAVDLSDGSTSPIATSGDGFGADLIAPFDIAVSADGSRALVADGGDGTSNQPAIVSIDLNSRTRTIASGANSGAGAAIILPEAIAVDDGSNRSLVVDPILNAVVTVDDTNGDRAGLTSADVGGGAVFNGPFNVAYDAASDRALVTDFNRTIPDNAAVYTVNLDNGERGILSGAGTGSGPEFDSLVNLTIGDSQVFVTDIDQTSVFAVDIANGNRTQLTNTFGANRSPLGIGIDTSANTLYVSVIVANNAALPIGSELFSLPTSAGTASQVALSGSSLRFAPNLVVDSEAGTAFIVDSKLDINDANADQLLAVTLAGGATSSLGSIEGAVPPQENELPNQDITLLGNEIVAVDSFQRAMFAIDRETNLRREISGDAVGNGPALQGPTGVSYASGRNILLVADRSSFAIFAVEPGSGDRVIISR